MAPLAALVLDVVSVIVFTVLGRNTHLEGFSVRGTIEVAAPFLVALGVGWLVTRAWRWPAALPTGVAVWAVTVAGGMVLRRFVFDRGTAPSFMVVASVFLAATIVGWRLVARLVQARRAAGVARSQA